MHNSCSSVHATRVSPPENFNYSRVCLPVFFLPIPTDNTAVQVVGTGDDGSSPCLVVSVERAPRYSGGEPTENKILRRYLLNVGEGTQVCVSFIMRLLVSRLSGSWQWLWSALLMPFTQHVHMQVGDVLAPRATTATFILTGCTNAAISNQPRPSRTIFACTPTLVLQF